VSGHTVRADIREELARAAKNANWICLHIQKIQVLCVKGNRKDLVSQFDALGMLAIQLQDFLEQVRESM